MTQAHDYEILFGCSHLKVKETLFFKSIIAVCYKLIKNKRQN